MRYISIIIVFLFIQTSLYSQTPSPGGVKSPEFWITTHLDKADKKIKWGDEKNNRLDKITGDTLNINFHPSKKFNGNDILKLHNTNIEQKTFVGAFYPEYNTTTIRSDIFFRASFNGLPIFTFKNNTVSIDSTLITDKQQFDYNPDFNINSQGELISTMKIATYSYSRIPKSSPNPWGEEKEFQINFPFVGYIPELLIYDRVLTNNELIRVHSYLAIKYGLTLPKDSNYYNSNGKVIWNASENKTYHNRVTAIGKDISGAIEQPFGNTTYEDFFNNTYSYSNDANGKNRSVTIGFTKESYEKLSDKTFLFCGDDNQSISQNSLYEIDKKQFPNLWATQRNWLMQNDNSISLSTKVKLGNPLKAELDRKVAMPAHYLIVITGNVIRLNDIHPFNYATENNEYLFDNELSNIDWNSNSKSKFSFAVSEKLRFKAKRANRTIVKNRKRCSGNDFIELDESVLSKSLNYKSGFYYHRGDKWYKRCIYRINYGYDNQNLTFFCEGGIGDTLTYKITDKQGAIIPTGTGTTSRTNATGGEELKIAVTNLKGEYFLYITDETNQTSKLPISIK